MARTSAELTPEEILIIGDLVPVGSPGQVPTVNAGGTGLEYKTISLGGYALTSNPLSQFASTTSAQLAGVISDETGSGGNLVFSNSPTLTLPNIAGINVSGGILTLPTGASDTLVRRNATETLTNKTIDLGSNTLTGTLSQFNTACTDDNFMYVGTVQNITAAKNFFPSTFGMVNVASTIISFFSNAATIARTWTFPDKNGTVAMTSDITGTNSGTNTGDQTSIVGITGTLSQFNTACTDADFATGGGTATGTNTGDNATNATSDAYALTTPDFYKYSIVRTVSSGNLTVALKNYLGNDPTSAVPVKIQIGDTVRTITGALSVGASAGVNLLNAGSTELATKEIDYFTYLGFKSSDSSIQIAFSRYPSANIYSDFAVGNVEKGVDSSSPLASTDTVVNIGRFNAILSAGAGYTWSIPATSVVINSPKNLSRNSLLAPQFSGSGGSAGTFAYTLKQANYTIRDSKVSVQYSLRITNLGSWTGDLRISLPFTAKSLMTDYSMLNGAVFAPSTNIYTASKGFPILSSGNLTSIYFWGSSAETAYLAWSGLAVNDTIYINTEYEI